MVVVSAVIKAHELPEDARTFAHDTLTLGWEDRTYVRGRRRTDGGVEVGTSLPRGTVLRAGDCFVLDDLRLVVAIVERSEPVFVIAPRSAPEWALYAYHIGNRHQPVMVTDRGLVCPDVPGVEQLLQQHHMPYERARLPFTPTVTMTGHHGT
jgi:urease accessory protein